MSREKSRVQKTRKCFGIMPLTNSDLNDIYTWFIKSAIEKFNFECFRADELSKTGTVIYQIFEAIRQSDLIVADLTGNNPNVLYELGYCAALNKTVVLLTQSIETIPFDLKHLKCIPYKPTPKGCMELRITLIEYMHEIFGNMDEN